MAGPEVPFPLKPFNEEPGVPFSLRSIDEVMCRDCPFPAMPTIPEDAKEGLGSNLQKWKDDVLRTASGKMTNQTLEDMLKGHELLVVGKDQGAPMDFRPNRVIVHIDENRIVTHVQAGV